MGIESLLARLEAEVEERDAAIEAEANRQAAEIVAAADRAVCEERVTFHHARELELRRDLDAAVADARHAANAETLTARERLLERVFAEAARGISALTDDARLLDSLPERLTSAQRFIGDAAFVVRCTPALLEALKHVAEGVTIEATGDVGTGFVVETDDGALTIDATLERALERRRREIAARLLARLEELEPCPSTSAT